MTRRRTAFLLACLLACVLLRAGCGKKPATPTRPPAYVNETDVPTFGKPWTVPGLGLELVFVEAGSFMMGSKRAREEYVWGGGDDTELRYYEGEQPMHEVRITRSFWMGRYEVMQAQHRTLTGSNPSRFRKGLVLGEEEREWWLWRKLCGPRKVTLTEDTSVFPVETVSWDDAVAFSAELTDLERRAGRLPAGYEYRLPTEAEWEYAARGGAGGRTTKYAGGDVLGEVAWHDGNSDSRPHPVGGKRPNELGLHDMSGNVWEWCLDWCDWGYYASSPVADPLGPATGPDLGLGPRRVFRGGSWGLGSDCRVADRGRWAPPFTHDGLGFRIVLAPTIEQPEQ